MVKVKYLLLFTLLTFGLFAQVPQAINYQGILRNSDGQSVPNKNITLRLSILSFKPNADIGSVEYSEEIKTKTNEFGIYTLAIGKGTPIKGQFSSILWGKSTTKVQIDIDENQTNNFEFAGTLELASVPYSLYAETAKYAENSAPGMNGLNGSTWLSGTSAPATNLGVQNDFYINTSTGDYYKKTGLTTWTFQTNLTGPIGPQGLTGQTGAQGIQGPQGTAGINGTNGANGLNGATWLSGTTMPSGTLGVQNDFYINTSNGDYFKKTGFAAWTFQTNLTGSMGPQGPAGPQGLQGAQGLIGQTGAQGLQGPQGAAGINGTNGTNGLNGATWLSGTTVPSGALGVQNDFYINTSNGDYYKKTGFTTWTFQTNLTGPTGPQGPAGPQGVQGIQGLTGQTESTRNSRGSRIGWN